MNKKFVFAMLSSVLFTQNVFAVDAEACKTEVASNLFYGNPTPLGVVLQTLSTDGAFALSYQKRDQEPVVQGRINGSVLNAAVRLIDVSIANGWKINYRFDKALCKFNVEVFDEKPKETVVATQVVATSATATATAPTPASSSPSRASIKSMSQMLLVAGKTISGQMNAIARDAGWQIIWEANDYIVEQSVTLGTDFPESLKMLIDSMNSNGNHIKATFFRGNNIVRVTEF